MNPSPRKTCPRSNRSSLLTTPSQRVSSPISAQHLNAPVFVPKAPPFQPPTPFALPQQTDLIPQYDLDPHAAALQMENLGIEHMVHLFSSFPSLPLPYSCIYRTSAVSRLQTHTTTLVLPPILVHLQTTTSTTECPSRFPNRNNHITFSSCEILSGKNSNIERRIFGHQPLSLCRHRRKCMCITH